MPTVIPFTNPADDKKARQRITESLDESLLVEAAAGTGKTTELIERIVAVLRTGRALADRLVAVTFTRKAAGELKLRLRQKLDEAFVEARARDAGSDEVARLEQAIKDLETAHIGTIHSFCAELLRARPVEANIDPAFQELSGVEAQWLYRQAFRRWSQEQLAVSPPGLSRCLSRLAARASSNGDSPLDEIEYAGWSLIRWRDYNRRWQRPPFDRTAAIDRLLEDAFHLAALAARAQRSTDELAQALRPAVDLKTWTERFEAVSKREYDTLEGRLLVLLTELKRKTKDKTGRGMFAEGLAREAVIAARDRVVQDLEEFKDHADSDLAAQLQDELQGLMLRYEELKRRAGALDFVDLLLKARDLVRDNNTARRYYQDRFHHIFVDEFQDTDPLQAELLLLLAASDPDERDWLSVTPTPGKLFLVGDPKQSVYRFRRADLILYRELRESLTAKKVPVLHLTTSYRALPSLQECVNAAFRPEMIESAAAGQAGYVPLRQFRKEGSNQPSVVALPVPEPYGMTKVTNTAIEKCLPKTVAAFVKWLIEESGWTYEKQAGEDVPFRSSDVCILFRRFSSWGTDMTRDYVREFEVRNIPHLLVGARSFHQREEVETLRAALTAIEWPDDELAVFATLKGSLFAIPDSLLLRFHDQFRRIHPFHSLPADLTDGFESIREALEILARLHRGRNWRPAVETVNELLHVTRAHAGFAFRPAGNQVLANVHRIADMARSFEVSGGVSFRGFVEELTRQAEREESDEAPVLEEGVEGVRIMTVHAAKGLEFPAVILADITAKLSRAEPEMYVDGHTQEKLCAVRLVGCAPWDLIDHRQEEADRDQAEGVRVAYVAATRARDLLVVPAVGDGPTDGWVSPLNKAIYPPLPLRRQSSEAPRCPEFGADSVLERAGHLDEPPQHSVKPGLHRPEVGEHSVVWWDPATLELDVKPSFGLRQKEILEKDPGERVARAGIERYRDWSSHRGTVTETGKRPTFEVFTPTESIEGPPDFEAAIVFEALPRPAHRPQGPRFGTLVHTVLRDVELGAGSESAVVQEERSRRAEIERLARLHARVLGSPEPEIEAAVEAVAATLGHPLLGRARRAARRHRELPIMLKTEGGRLLEGNIDLAFLEDGEWTVVDFKTDADLPTRQQHYRHQLEWYVFALSRMTQQPARGWLLGI